MTAERVPAQGTADVPHSPASSLADRVRGDDPGPSGPVGAAPNAPETPPLESVLVQHERYRRALVRIANAESGWWGRIAHEALHPSRGASA